MNESDIASDVLCRFLKENAWDVTVAPEGAGFRATAEHADEGSRAASGATKAEAVCRVADECWRAAVNSLEPTEIVSDGPGGWPVPPEVLDLDVYRLLCVFAASSQIASLSEKPGDYYGRLRNMMEPAEASRLLIGIATVARNQLDSASDRNETQKLLPRNVGTLRPLNGDSDPKQLDFREACNKIIHADLVHFDGSPTESPAERALSPRVHLYGTHYGKRWKATIDVFSFLRGCELV